MMDRYLLRYFLTVIDAGNFSRAAALCNVAQPTLSVGIAKLERQAGQALFHRTNRRVELTAAGARLAVHARRIEMEFGLAERAVRGAPPPATLRLGVLATIPSDWIEAFAGRIGDTPGHHSIEIVEGRERELIERLSRGRIDVALTLIRADSDRFAAERLFEEGYSLALPIAHRLAGRHTIAAGELADNVMIVRRQCELLAETSRHFTARGVRPFLAARPLADERAIRYVRGGLGITVMPDCFRNPGIARPKLADFAFTRTIGLLYGPHVDRPALRGGDTLTALVATVRAAQGEG